jgi:CDGSH-type Zn-finger protein
MLSLRHPSTTRPWRHPGWPESAMAANLAGVCCGPRMFQGKQSRWCARFGSVLSTARRWWRPIRSTTRRKQTPGLWSAVSLSAPDSCSPAFLTHAVRRSEGPPHSFRAPHRSSHNHIISGAHPSLRRPIIGRLYCGVAAPARRATIREMAKITPLSNGPIRIEGEFAIYDPQGNEFGLAGRTVISLCRCGQSANKPFCDGSHARTGFQDTCVARELPPPKPKPA